MRTTVFALAAAALFATAAHAAPATYAIDPSHTFATFEIDHFGASVNRARFDKKSGTIVIDPVAKTGQIEINIDMASISTGTPSFDGHLKSKDFFNAEAFPTATFKSTKVEAAGEGKLALSGDLTIHGVTLPTTFEVAINQVGDHPMKGKPAAGFDATGKIDRTAFGIDKYAQATGPEVKLAITIEALVE